MTTRGSNVSTHFQQLSVLAGSLDLQGLGGYHECREIMTQSADKRQSYLTILTTHVPLFRKSEKKDAGKRAKFLNRMRRAATHFLDVYCKAEPSQDDEVPTLSKHPSHGMSDMADKVYRALDHNWTCQCSHRGARWRKTKEARLSLTRHRRFEIAGAQRSVKFELLLPICKDDAVWKAANFEVRQSRYALLLCVFTVI